MMDPSHLLREVIRPVLHKMDLHSQDAERLILGTACAESDCGHYIKQIAGPAVGIYQCEPATHEDIWNHFLTYQPELAKKVNYWRVCYGNGIGADELAGNLYYATAICRVHYYRRAQEPIPSTLYGQAAYWCRYYNTLQGKGTMEKYIAKWDQFVGRGTMIGDPFLTRVSMT